MTAPLMPLHPELQLHLSTINAAHAVQGMPLGELLEVRALSWTLLIVVVVVAVVGCLAFWCWRVWCERPKQVVVAPRAFSMELQRLARSGRPLEARWEGLLALLRDALVVRERIPVAGKEYRELAAEVREAHEEGLSELLIKLEGVRFAPGGRDDEKAWREAAGEVGTWLGGG